MKKPPYTGLWTILAIALVIFVLLSIPSTPISVCGVEIQQATFISDLTAATKPHKMASKPDGKSTDTLATKKPTAKSDEPVPTDTTSKTILFIGDSMLEGLSPRLGAYANYNRHKLYSVIWYSSTTEIWGRSKKISEYIKQFHPDYVFVCLGANELFVRNIEKKRSGYIDNILSQIGDLPYVWIGPPNWKKDTGINKLIASKSRPGTFFLSDGMEFDRAKDGAHPTRKSAKLWMDSVARWMKWHCAHPIKMEFPPEGTSTRPARTIMLQPSK